VAADAPPGEGGCDGTAEDMSHTTFSSALRFLSHFAITISWYVGYTRPSRGNPVPPPSSFSSSYDDGDDENDDDDDESDGIGGL
jgi:hypothetical protein